MKKQLLFVAAIAAGMCATAQDYVQVDATGLGLNSEEKLELAEGTEIGRTESFVLSTAFVDTYKALDLKGSGDCNLFVFDGVELSSANGFQGNTNPKDADGNGPASKPAAPVTGAAIKITAMKDGFVYVWGKLSTHKSYVVCENGLPLGYRIVMQSASLGKVDVTVNGSDEYNYVYEPIAWPEVIFTGDENSAVKDGACMGVIKFAVFKDCEYLVCASGSKIMVGGAWFDVEGDVNVAVKSSESGTSYALLGDGAGINNAVVADVVAEEVYTISGQKATAAATGVVLVKKTFADGSVKTVKVIR